MIKFYGYPRCSTCRKALGWLEEQGVGYQFIDITETPPRKALLKKLLGKYELKRLFNTSGQLYRELNMKERLPDLSRDEAIDLLASHGKLCKRPIVSDGTRHTVGFREDEYLEVWG